MATIIGTRSPLFYKQVAGGLPAIIDTSAFTGNVFFVDSAAPAASDTAGFGTTPDAPFATIDFAIGQCTANQGDVILVLPGHAESINTAGGITCDKAGVSIIGLGQGEDRPTITVGTSLDTSTILVSAADVRLANLIIQPGNDGVDVLIDINADGCIVEDCEIRSDEANAYQFDTGIDINGGGANAADRCIIRRNKITSIAAGAVQGIEIGAVQAGTRIEDNWIEGDYSVAAIHSASILTNSLIARDYLHNVNAADFCIELSAAATGLLVDNRFYADAAATTLDPGSMMCVGNQMVNAIDQSSIPVPTTAGGVLPTGAIGAASFAAGAIDAAAIANGAIDAATFAAGAIDAAALAAGAIDLATYAADALTLAGTRFVVTKTLTSSAIVQAGVDVTGVASGDIWVENIIVQSNSVGLVTGTNFEIQTNNANGKAKQWIEAVATIGGANKSGYLLASGVTAGIPFVLESTKKITCNTTVADGTGAGTITLYILCVRLANGGALAAA